MQKFSIDEARLARYMNAGRASNHLAVQAQDEANKVRAEIDRVQVDVAARFTQKGLSAPADILQRIDDLRAKLPGLDEAREAASIRFQHDMGISTACREYAGMRAGGAAFRGSAVTDAAKDIARAMKP